MTYHVWGLRVPHNGCFISVCVSLSLSDTELVHGCVDHLDPKFATDRLILQEGEK